MSTWSEDALQCDAFLGGKVQLWQPRKGYRAGIDPVLLAASVKAQAGQSILELGCGAGAAMLCLSARVDGLDLLGVERETPYAELAARNIAQAGAQAQVVCADLTTLPQDVTAQNFDHVIANPPYYDRAAGSRAPNPLREAALGEETALCDWIRVGAKRLKPKGYLTLILKANRLGDALAAIQERLGSIEVLPIAPRIGRSAELILLRARKDGRGALVLHAPLILHEGESHLGDFNHYSENISRVLRCGAALDF